MALGPLGLAVADLACAALVLYALLPPNTGLPCPAFLGVYVMAVAAGIVSRVPGGLGVFESVLLLALPAPARGDLLAAILAYRFIYYLLPPALSALLVTRMALRARRRQLAEGVAQLRRLLAWLAPMAVNGNVFVAGAVLLSGSLPADTDRLHLLRHVVPLAMLEISRLAGSLAGLGLAVLAQGLYRRVDLAYRMAEWWLGAGAVFSLLKGLAARRPG